MSNPYWLIEYRRDGRTIGYLKDAVREGRVIDVLLTKHPSSALRFDSKAEAEVIFNDPGFPTPPDGDSIAIYDHLDCAGPTHDEIDAVPEPPKPEAPNE